MRILLLIFAVLMTSSVMLPAQRQLSLTFDDGSVDSVAGFAWREWNAMWLKKLQAAEVRALFFVCGKAVDSPAGDSLLNLWDAAGHVISNHTYSHHFLNSPRISAKTFVEDIRRNDSIVADFNNFERFFRFPYLKEGETRLKRDSVRAGLAQMGYRNGHVSIDASDWYYNGRLVKFLKSNPQGDVSKIRDLYLAHMLDRAQFYDSLAYAVEGRQIKHSLLVHHNLINALFLDDLINMFREHGWEFIDPVDVFDDPIYQRVPDVVPAGESIVWSLAKERGGFEAVLRYPAEDGRYEAAVLDAAGF